MLTRQISTGLFYRTLTALILVMQLTGCASLEFYQQAITGQGRLLLERKAVDELIVDPETDPGLRERLELVREILVFAEDAGLPVENAYTSYVATGQPFIVWNVFAAPELELRLETSCFPIAGCVTYRGYFNQQDAQAHAALLKREGYDVYVGGVTAYSTLGWFDDPLLDTFLFSGEEYLAALLFHELAHRLVYVKGDTRFNESFATAVEQVILRDWLTSRGDRQRYARYLASEARRQSVLELIDQLRQELRVVYGSEADSVMKLRTKSELIQQSVADYRAMADQWPEGDEFSNWMKGEINNAKLETVADYNSWVPVMRTYLQANGLPAFVAEMERLARLPQSKRNLALESLPVLLRAVGNR